MNSITEVARPPFGTASPLSDEVLESYTVYRHFKHILKAPFDTAERVAVVASACRCIEAYGQTLHRPTAVFLDISRRTQELLKAISPFVPSGFALQSDPLYRRLQKHPAWALCFRLAAIDLKEYRHVFEAAGVEIALGLVTTNPFRKGFADSLRRPITPERIEFTTGVDWEKAYLKTRIRAAAYFEEDPSADDNGVPVQLFDLAAGLQLTRKALYAAPRRRQCVLDRGTQTTHRFLDSAARIGNLVRLGDDTAVLRMLATMTGLSLALTKDAPLDEPRSADGWTMWINTRDGVVVTSLDAIARKAARGGGTMYRPNGKALVTPLPTCLAAALQARRAELREAKVVGDLLPKAETRGRSSTLEEATSSMTPSVARFLASSAPYFVQEGMDRLTAAAIFKDFAVVPISKLYYCSISPAEIWQAAGDVFEELGWGAPVEMAGGVSVGSRVVPTRSALGMWHQCMQSAIADTIPGRHASDERLFAFHNEYSRVCASVAVLNLAAREQRVFRFTTWNLAEDAIECSYADKWVGPFPAPHSVPVCRMLREQVRLWYAHCRSLHGRLERRKDKRNSALVDHLRRLLSGERRHLFFEITATRSPSPLGSSHLLKWWPEHCRFEADFGRHFWESELRQAGLPSTLIDWFMRHVIDGIATRTSIASRTIEEMSDAVISVQDRLLYELGIRPITGLAKR